MALPFVLSNGREFKSQKAAKEHFREILRAYENGRVITDPSHHDDLVALLERYDNAVTDTSSKIGTGIDHFERRINPGSGYSTPGFWVCGATIKMGRVPIQIDALQGCSHGRFKHRF
jgi:hypothetical protein